MSIYAYVLRRLIYVIPIILGVSFIIFLLFNVIAGDPTPILLGKHATLKQIEELRHELGLDRSLFSQYLDIVKSAFTFDFGRSWSTKQQISEILKEGAIPSLTVSVPAFTISSVVAIVLGLLVSFFRGRWPDKLSVFMCVALMSISALAYILFGQWFLAYKMDLFEISGYEFGFPHFIPYVILPGIIWVILSIGPDLRIYRTIFLDEVYQDYVRTARAKGLSEFKVYLKHILKNAMIPITTYLIIQIPFLILGALLLENFFSIPGLGSIVMTAINSYDFPVIKAMAILSSLAYIIFGIITDVFYTIIDPRVRLK